MIVSVISTAAIQIIIALTIAVESQIIQLP